IVPPGRRTTPPPDDLGGAPPDTPGASGPPSPCHSGRSGRSAGTYRTPTRSAAGPLPGPKGRAHVSRYPCERLAISELCDLLLAHADEATASLAHHLIDAVDQAIAS